MTLRIAVLSKAGGSGGGASRVAVELVQGLRARGHAAVHWASWITGGQGTDSRQLYGKGLGTIGFLAHNGIRKMGFGELVPFELPNLIMAGLWRNFDLLHVHDTSSAISPFTVSWFSKRLPTVMTLHDCSPFTGGCINPMGCVKFLEGCGNCPQLGSWPLNCWSDQTRLLDRVKKRLLSSGRVHLVAPSEWIADLAMSSRHVLERPTILSNGVDTRVFSPTVNRNRVRAAFGIQQDRLVVLMAANTFSDRRKVGPGAIEALRRITDLRPFLIAVGTGSREFAEEIRGIEHHLTGFVSDRDSLADWYRCADLHLFPSVADNQPLVVLETMSCGVATVGFATGGVPEMIKSDTTGWLADVGDVDGLVTGMRRAAEGGRAIQWGRACRQLVLGNFSMESFIDRHLRFYERQIERWHLKMDNHSC